MMSTETPLSSTPRPPVATASAWLAVLQEDDPQLQQAALKQLYAHCDELWHEIAQALPDLEALAEQTQPTDGSNSKIHLLAACVASRVLFHLQEHEQALKWALVTTASGDADYDCFQQQQDSPYTTTLIAAALDAYIALQQQQHEQLGESTTKTSSSSEHDWTVEQLQPLVHRLLQAACERGHFEYAVGVALEACELPVLKDILQQSGPSVAILKYTLQAVSNSPKQFRTAALTVLAEFWQVLFTNAADNSSERSSVCYDLVHVLHTLQAPDRVAQVLAALLEQNSNAQDEDALLTALQLAFDLQDTGHHAFVQAVADALVKLVPNNDNETENETNATTTVTAPVLKVLTGGFASELQLSFLHKQNKADRLLMEQLKKGVETGSRSNSVLHNAAVVTHSYLYAGTTNDSFLRDYLDWMKKAGNWYVLLIY